MAMALSLPAAVATVPRDLYTQPVDFAALALKFPDFAKKLKSNGQLDFSDPESVRQLTKCLLKRDFALDIEVPEDRLCPPVPNRYNYILWLHDLLDTSRGDYEGQDDPNSQVIGLDIGTGASCIYPLLGCRARDSWKFFATDIDEKSIQYARMNINRNSLSSRIIVNQRHPSEPLIPTDILAEGRPPVSFTMLNPPFYSSPDDMQASAAAKPRPPHSSCTGAPIEMIYEPGGEIAFVTRLLTQSLDHDVRYRIQWFTTMLGKLSSVSSLLDRIRDAGCTNYAVTEFIQGSKTRRWGVGWSWLPYRPAERAARGTDALGKASLPPKTETTFTIPVTQATDSGSNDPIGRPGLLGRLTTEINQLIQSIEGVHWTWNPSLCEGVGTTTGNVWGRKARRQKQQQQRIQQQQLNEPLKENSPSSSPSGPIPAETFTFKISLRLNRLALSSSSSSSAATTTSPPPPATDPSYNNVDVQIRWIKGNDAVVFESFCEMVRRNVIVGKEGGIGQGQGRG